MVAVLASWCTPAHHHANRQLSINTGTRTAEHSDSRTVKFLNLLFTYEYLILGICQRVVKMEAE